MGADYWSRLSRSSSMFWGCSSRRPREIKIDEAVEIAVLRLCLSASRDSCIASSFTEYSFISELICS